MEPMNNFDSDLYRSWKETAIGVKKGLQPAEWGISVAWGTGKRNAREA